jgi:hypothetical protein
VLETPTSKKKEDKGFALPVLDFKNPKSRPTTPEKVCEACK